MTILANRPIAVRIALIALVPLLAAALFAYSRITDSWTAVNVSEDVERSVAIAKDIGDLVHELQKERGMSAGYVASGGAKFAEALSEQQQKTDRLLKAVQQATGGSRELSAALDTFHDIGLMRERTISQEASVGEVARFYTSGIGLLIDSMNSKGYASADPEIGRMFAAYTAISRAKEKAGLERAMGASGFGAGQFAPDIYDRFVGLRAEQEVHLDAFSANADQAAKGALARVLASEDAQAVFAMRELARQGLAGTQSVDAEVWWARTTGKIDALKTVEDAVGDELALAAAAKRIAARNALLGNTALVALACLLALTATLLVSRSITRPLHRLEAATSRMASGDYETEVGVAETRDEIGSLAASTRLFREQLLAGEQAREAHARDREDNLRLVEKRARRVDELTGRFDADMSGALTIFADSVQTLMVAADELDAKASETSERSVRVASASQQTNTNVQIVASATEELSLSIEEIVGQVSRGTRSMADASSEAKIANADMKALDSAAREIDEVVRLIADIAEQTNVLALNATIEAARAGTQGAGFAVVANEVRVLAEQTAQATRRIGDTVGEVVEKSDRASRGMDRIALTLQEVEQAATAMSAALEQQGAAARNIAQSVQEAASAVEQVDANIAEIEQSSARARDQVQSVIGAATQFNERAGSVRGSVDEFLSSIKAA